MPIHGEIEITNDLTTKFGFRNFQNLVSWQCQHVCRDKCEENV